MRRPIPAPARKLPARLAALAAALLLGASASAQTSRPDRGDGAGAADPPRGVLAGPQVDDDEKGDGASFLEQRRDRRREGAGNARRWLRLVGELDLLETQRAAVRAEVAALARERRAFQREHGEELRSLQREIRGARQSDRDAPREQIVRLQELQSLAPRPDAAQERIWALLTPAQRTELRRALAREQAARRARRERDTMTPPPGEADDADPALDEAARRRLRFLLQRRERPATPGGA